LTSFLINLKSKLGFNFGIATPSTFYLFTIKSPSVEITGFYGLRFPSKKIAFLIDDRDTFIKWLELN
jgi:hypothetical protein